ncbi:probable cysteine--tRNA ligase, mitochondrial [Hetaerina americana]|uniref:probable cysteine--tRNA ligase, mitochondrial n=1 Tax=Hetaerina americana TaxID=62018 RepID=UPI003A7F2FF8
MHIARTCGKRFLEQRSRIPDFFLNRLYSAFGSVCSNNVLPQTRLERIIRREVNGKNGNSDYNKWKLPSGYKTDICIYNTIIKYKVPLVLRNKSFVTWYMCGPTVYDSAHLGHACCYVKFDVIRRILEQFFGINVVMAMSVTDVDDKIINRANERKEDITNVSRHFEAEFWNDMKLLNVTPPNATLRVTKHIDEIISFVSKLIDVGMAYTAVDGSVYFNTGSYSNYGKFVSVSPEEAGGYDESSHNKRIIDENIKYKRSPMDFALWKSSPDTNEPGWQSPWGRGRPGWHIECSAMASKLFGSRVDLHSGGVDLIFPHHENEEAQSCAHHGVSQWVNYWIHTGHLHLKGQEKMSKSLKNTLSIREFLSDYTANQFRMFCLLSHYRSGVAYTKETMENAVATMNKIESFLAEASAYVLGKKEPVYLDELELEKNVSHFEDKMQSSFADDFNTPTVVSALMELISYCNKILNPSSKLSKANLSLEKNSTIPIAAVAILIIRTLEKLGIDLRYDLRSSYHEPAHGKGHSIHWKQLMDVSISFRNEVRGITLDELNKRPKNDPGNDYLKKILAVCDAYRKSLAAEGVTVKDHEKSSTWTVAKVDGKIKN